MFGALFRAIRGRGQRNQSSAVAVVPAGQPDRAPANAELPRDDVAAGHYYLDRLRHGTFWQRLTARAKLAGIFERREMLEEAAACYEAILRAGVRSPDLYERLAVIYRRLERHELADDALAAMEEPAPRPRAADGSRWRTDPDEPADGELGRLAASLHRLEVASRGRAPDRRRARAAAEREFTAWIDRGDDDAKPPAGQRKRAKELWSDAEDRYILEHIGEPARAVAEGLGRSVQSIYRRRSELRREGRVLPTVVGDTIPPSGLPRRADGVGDASTGLNSRAHPTPA